MKIRCFPDGSVKIEMEGFTGDTCLKVSAPFEELVGKVESRDEKPEMYEQEQEVLLTQGN
jgi:hypothetical protein